MCVDDNASILKMLAAMFYKGGYDVEMAKDAFVALHKLKENPQRFPVIVTDIRMPGMDGFGLIEQARHSGYTGQFVVFAATISPDDRQRLEKLRVQRVLSKPARPEDLISAVKEVQASF